MAILLPNVLHLNNDSYNIIIDYIKEEDINTTKWKFDLINFFENIAKQDQKIAVNKCNLLSTPLRQIESNSNNNISNIIINLNNLIKKIDPNNNKFSIFLFKIFKISNYFNKYTVSEEELFSLIKNIEKQSKILKRDNITLDIELNEFKDLEKNLKFILKFLKTLKDKIDNLSLYLNNNSTKKFIDEEVLYLLSSKIIDLQQQLIVIQQGILAVNIIKKNNFELIIKSTKIATVTFSAIKVAQLISKTIKNKELQLNNIKDIEKNIKSVSTKLSLDTNSINDYKIVNFDVLKNKFLKINNSVSDLFKYKNDSYDEVSQNIVKFDKIKELT